MTIPNENAATDNRMKWVEPALTLLQVSETANQPSRGGDSGPYLDCTRS